MFLAEFHRLALAGLAAVGLSTFLTIGEVEAAEKEPAGKIIASKLDLTRESLPKLLSLIRPHENEWRHLKVEWLTDVVAARKKAAAEDKPIVICYTGGAGYNEPLGVC